MTTKEFSEQFDVLYNNIASNKAPGLDEYEKSVFLTKAQNEIINNYFNPKGNKYQEGFDDSLKRQIDFSNLVTVKEPTVFTDSSYVKFDDRSILYTLPSDILFIINETAINTINGLDRLISIIPISFAEYSRYLSRPYKQPYKNQGWRLLQRSASTQVAEIIVKTDSTLSDYKLRYIKKPNPIILIDLEDSYGDLKIDGKQEVTECELHESIHEEILQRAVELAKASYIGDINSTVELGQRSE